MKLSARARKEFQALGRKFGALGGKKAARNMTLEQRQERARKAGKAGAAARWGKRP